MNIYRKFGRLHVCVYLTVLLLDNDKLVIIYFDSYPTVWNEGPGSSLHGVKCFKFDHSIMCTLFLNYPLTCQKEEKALITSN